MADPAPGGLERGPEGGSAGTRRGPPMAVEVDLGSCAGKRPA